MKKMFLGIFILCMFEFAIAKEGLTKHCVPLCDEGWNNATYNGELCSGVDDYLPQVNLIVNKMCVHNPKSVTWLSFFCETKEHNYYDYSVNFCKNFASLDEESLKEAAKLGPLGVLRADPCVRKCVSEYAYMDCVDL
jgi:hypothetical protein